MCRNIPSLAKIYEIERREQGAQPLDASVACSLLLFIYKLKRIIIIDEAKCGG